MLNYAPNRSHLQEMTMRFQAVARFDHSVSVPELGSLFHFDERKAVGKMQQGLAGIYDVPFAYVTTNGTTSLNVLALLAITRPGDTILCQRDSHVSIFAPIIHADLIPLYLEPVYQPQLGINLGVTPAQLRTMLRQHPQIKAIFLTYPNYFGIAADIRGCAAVAAEFGIPLIVDSAHGAHLGFHPDLPEPAQQTSAAIVTQSTHKTCAALSQGSLALFNDEALVPRFYEAVNHLGLVSTSFSYVILASVVMAVLQLQNHGHQLLARAVDVAAEVRDRINRIEGLFSFGPEFKQAGFIGFDPLRITVDVSRFGLTGFKVEEILIEEFRIYPEMATLQNVLFLLTMADNLQTGCRVVEALQTIARRYPPVDGPAPPPIPPAPPQILPPRPVFFAPNKTTVPARQSVGRISAETIACYPPGSAIIVAGERITPEVIDFLQESGRRGGTLKGASDPAFHTIQVIK